MNYIKLSQEELENEKVGEAITIATIMTVMLAAVMVVVLFKMLKSNKGSTTIPGGWKFTWN